MTAAETMYDNLIVETKDQSDKINIAFQDKNLTVRQFKSTILRRLGRKPETHDELALFYLGNELDDDRTLRSYLLKDGVRITRIDRAIAKSAPTDQPPEYEASRTIRQLFLQHFNGTSYPMEDVETSWTVQELKDRFATAKGFPDSNFRLIYGGKEFHPNLTLERYGLSENCTIFIVVSLYGGL